MSCEFPRIALTLSRRRTRKEIHLAAPPFRCAHLIDVVGQTGRARAGLARPNRDYILSQGRRQDRPRAVDGIALKDSKGGGRTRLHCSALVQCGVAVDVARAAARINHNLKRYIPINIVVHPKTRPVLAPDATMGTISLSFSVVTIVIYLIAALRNLVTAVAGRDDDNHVGLGVREVVHLAVQGGISRPHCPPAVGAYASPDRIRRSQHLGLGSGRVVRVAGLAWWHKVSRHEAVQICESNAPSITSRAYARISIAPSMRHYESKKNKISLSTTTNRLFSLQ